jgi:hypothetical protein
MILNKVNISELQATFFWGAFFKTKKMHLSKNGPKRVCKVFAGYKFFTLNADTQVR